MHHLLVTIGSHGDTHPFIGLGARLRARGHRVTVAANDHFEPIIRAAGLDFAELGTAEEFRKALDLPDMWHPMKSFRTVFEAGILPLIRRTYDLIAEHYVPGETIVTAHAIAFGARIAQETLNIPLATIHLAPSVLRSVHLAPRFGNAPFIPYSPRFLLHALWWIGDHFVADPVLAAPINAVRAEFGLPPVKNIIKDWWLSPQRVIGLWPEWFGPFQPDWPAQLKLTGFPLYDERGVHELAPELSAFLHAGDPPIAFTFGSAMLHARKYFEAAADACQRLGRRGIFLTRHPQQIPPNLPASVKHFDYAPFSELLPRCAALVHHGGIGTTSQALASGVPQLVMPFAFDQHDNAARVKRLGVGAQIAPKRFRAAKVAKVLRQLLDDPGLPARCRTVAAKFNDHDPLGEACDLIEQLVSDSAVAGRSDLGKSPSPIPS